MQKDLKLDIWQSKLELRIYIIGSSSQRTLIDAKRLEIGHLTIKIYPTKSHAIDKKTKITYIPRKTKQNHAICTPKCHAICIAKHDLSRPLYFCNLAYFWRRLFSLSNV